MDSNATSAPQVPHEEIRFAIRENFPSIFEPSHALGDTLNSIRTKINTLNEIANSTIGDTRGQEMTDAIDGLLDDSAEVEEQFKVWHEKLNVAYTPGIIELTWLSHRLTSIAVKQAQTSAMQLPDILTVAPPFS
ncbi:hypothetical protein J4E93_002762 [Alternaria ventricosa]|uniref:uncharacterized protein n=1 Tax=Alternaria ventricosa TaxID=1187951 RepID=UPI0020C2D6C6|nr:uncharacterized protein J4E93_002762 [Alternaria ventricosa]KAI4650406.1 hypothetical protein J4E93_002762 [Alternaria ventricosa]